MMNRQLVGKYFYSFDNGKIFRIDGYYYNGGQICFEGYLLDIETAKIEKVQEIRKRELRLEEHISVAEIDSIIFLLSTQSGLSFCF